MFWVYQQAVPTHEHEYTPDSYRKWVSMVFNWLCRNVRSAKFNRQKNCSIGRVRSSRTQQWQLKRYKAGRRKQKEEAETKSWKLRRGNDRQPQKAFYFTQVSRMRYLQLLPSRWWLGNEDSCRCVTTLAISHIWLYDYKQKYYGTFSDLKIILLPGEIECFKLHSNILSRY